MIFKAFSKYFLYLSMLIYFCSNWCMATNTLKEEYNDDSYTIENYRYNILEEINNENENRIISVTEKDEELSYSKNFCCIRNMFKFLYNKEKNYIYIEDKSFIQNIPNELIEYITSYLNVSSLIQLSYTSRKFKRLFNDDFWTRYNHQNHYQIFKNERSYLLLLSFNKEEFLPLKITLANYYYETGRKLDNKSLIRKAAFLGLPKAKDYLKKKMKPNYSGVRRNDKIKDFSLNIKHCRNDIRDYVEW